MINQDSRIAVLTRHMHGIGSVGLVLMMFFTVFDVVFRYLGRPLVGAYDVISLMGLIVLGFAIPETTRIEGHVFVDAVIEKMGLQTKRVVGVATRLLSVGLFVFLFAGSLFKGHEFQSRGEVSQTLHIPLGWAIYAFAFCGLIQCALIGVEVIGLIRGGTEHE
jgi:TRAP-type C4-dicarboxylate transport system permease small subunit